jgi:hypothetical protein
MIEGIDLEQARVNFCDAVKAGRISPSLPEPRRDIAAQIAAMLDPDHPKDAVFIAAGNEDALSVVVRPEGVLLTTDQRKAAAFRAGVDDVGMARILGYPEAKLAAILGGDPCLVQVRDRDGSVVQEAVSSAAKAAATADALAHYRPEGGSIIVLSPADAMRRRLTLR